MGGCKQLCEPKEGSVGMKVMYEPNNGQLVSCALGTTPEQYFILAHVMSYCRSVSVVTAQG